MRYVWAGASHVGRLRTNNEDSLAPEGEGVETGPFVVAVADGMGGHVAGEVASRLALNAAMEHDGTAEERVQAGNDRVVQEVVADPSLAGMGTTLTLVKLTETGTFDLAHIGDSRAYRLREGELEQMTRDHTLVADLIAEGRLRPEEVRLHPQRNLLTRVIGMARAVEVDELAGSLQPGDRLLLCSDGLTNMVDDRTIKELLEGDDAVATVWALIEAANDAGGEDNVTVIVVDVAE